MKRFVILIAVFFLQYHVFGQMNMTLLSKVDYGQLHGANLSDVWGYVDETGREYAIVGTTKGTSVLDITDPAQPSEVFWISGPNSMWRDPCVYGDFAYITTEAIDGITIIDLSPLPGSNNLPTHNCIGNPSYPIFSAHTCTIDEKGIAYIFGSNKGGGGVVFLDLVSDPTNPKEIGSFNDWYVHDGFVRNDTMFLAHIGDGFISLVDVSDKSKPVVLGTRNTPHNFSHSIWPSNDGKTIFTTDEVSNAYIASYDITNPKNIVEQDRYQNRPGSIPHNVHVRGDFLITSYFTDGVIINDITHPDNLIKVAQFDTYSLQNSGLAGAWGVYPFFPSGNIVVSDITEGLFILGVNYQKASYLEGVVTNAQNALPLSGVNVKIGGDDHIEDSKNDGLYKTGISGSGKFSVTFSKTGFYPQTVEVELKQGVVTVRNVKLTPIATFSLLINVYESGTTNPILDAKIALKAPLIEYFGLTNGLGQENFTLGYETPYEVTVGKWGYLSECFEQEINAATGVLNIYLQKGYADDFTFDMGWQVSGNALTGIWERGRPNGTSTGSAPSVDEQTDCSNKAFVTGNNPDFGPDKDDVDDGVTLLTSPIMDLSTYNDPCLNFAYWFYCLHGKPPDDTLKVSVNNGATTAVVAKLSSQEVLFYQWNPMSIRLRDYIQPTASMTVSFAASDDPWNVNITEAGIDHFSVTNGSMLGKLEWSKHFTIYPNPFNDVLTILDANVGEYALFGVNGNLIRRGKLTSPKEQIDFSALSNGTYLLQLGQYNVMLVKE